MPLEVFVVIYGMAACHATEVEPMDCAHPQGSTTTRRSPRNGRGLVDERPGAQPPGRNEGYSMTTILDPTMPPREPDPEPSQPTRKQQLARSHAVAAKVIDAWPDDARPASIAMRPDEVNAQIYRGNAQVAGILAGRLGLTDSESRPYTDVSIHHHLSGLVDDVLVTLVWIEDVPSEATS